MLSITDGYRAAVVGDVRHMLIKAMLEIVDPDIAYGTSRGSGVASFGRPDQLHDKNMKLDSRYITTEHNRWLLDGTFRSIPDVQSEAIGEIGHVGDVLSEEDGTFKGTVYAELPFSNVSILQACSIFFSDDPIDGIGADFTVAIYSSGQMIYSKEYTGNTDVSVSLDGFTVYNPTAIRVTVTKWSMPGRRLRIAEIIPGVYEEWTDDILASIDIQMRGNFACLAIPYGTCTLRMDNLDRRFEPRNKSGIFQSIEERQAIPVAMGVKLADGTVEYKRVGVFYQFSGGWKTGDNAMTMQWDLVDIVGLLTGREFKAPSTLPATLAGWLAALVGQLGSNFANRYHVDQDYADVAATVNSAADVEGKKCGDILRWVCMATGTWPRADAETGDLTAEPLWSHGNKYDLDNMTAYPVMKSNDDLAMLTFQIYDGNNTTYDVSGNSTSSSQTLTISNPFIHTQAQALAAAKQILSQYGGIKLETTGRGDPASEIGDVDTVWLDESGAATGRRMEQSFTFSNGILRDCKSVLLQANGSFLFEECALLTEDCTWTAPAGVTELRVVIGQGGQGGGKGQDGILDHSKQQVTSDYGADGVVGSGGKIWYGTISINPQQQFAVRIGHGGASSDAYGVPGAEGEETTFGAYSSANGKVYPNGYNDIANGDSYGRTGVSTPKNGTSDGAAGGKGGDPGAGYYYEYVTASGAVKYGFKQTAAPGPGHPGNPGADGFVLVFWDKEAAS